jgi:hypothetical protein
VFGVQQIVNLLDASGVRKDRAGFYSVTEEIVRQFAASPIVFGAFQFGDAAQQALVDLLWDVAKFRPLDPTWIQQKAGSVLDRSTAAARALTPGDNLRLTIALLRNTYGVIGLVNQAAGMLNLPPGPIDLQSAVDRAYSFGQYSPLWLVEGLGESHADRNWSDVAPVRGLLTEGQAAQLPEKSLLMMHAGIGISFAQHVLRPLTPVSSEAQVWAAVRRFIGLVRDNSRPGYEGPALESLGLVTHTWYSQIVPLIDRALWMTDRATLEYFWHGVGRSAYFTPLNLLPGSSAFQGVTAEAPHQLALLNATAGATWAFTLVNIQAPEVLFHLVRTNAPALAVNDAFTNGLISTVMMANDMIPGDPFTTALCAYAPQQADAASLQNWDFLVRQPCQRANAQILPILKRAGCLGEVFRYQDLDAFAHAQENR